MVVKGLQEYSKDTSLRLLVPSMSVRRHVNMTLKEKIASDLVVTEVLG